MTIILITLVIVAAIAAYFITKQKKKEPETSAEPEKANPLEGLLKISLDIRKSAMPIELVPACDRMVDLLADLIPRVDAYTSASGELQWTVNRIATEYFPNKCVYPFLQLSPEQRVEPDTISVFISNIQALADELNKVSAMLEAKDEQAFQAKAAFLQQRFDTGQ